MTIGEAYNLAVQHHQAGRLREAESLYRQILAQQPAHADSLHMLGLLAFQTGHHADGERLITEAIHLNPQSAAYHCDLGAVLATRGELAQAATAFQEATILQPALVEAHDNLGSALQRLGRIQDAIAAFRKAVELRPAYVTALRHLADALQVAGRDQEAVQAYQTLLRSSATDPEDHFNLGNVLEKSGRRDDAIASYRQALALRPAFAEAQNNLANVLELNGEIDEAAACYRESLRLRPNSAVWSNLIYALHLQPDDDPEQIREELARWNQTMARPLAGSISLHSNDPDPDRRLRIGYVSPHLAEHAVGRYLLPLIANHDRARFEVFCYSDVPLADAVTERLRAHADVWRDTLSFPDEQLASLIRSDQIDVLVDLTMHMQGNRMLMVARKPAPVQVTWLGYPGSTGLGTMDYRLTDPYLDPAEADEQLYSEKSVRLPHCYWCYQPQGDEPAPSELPALKNGFVTFGCLNHFSKINPRVLEMWAKVLAIPNSRLLVQAPTGHAREKLLDRLGIDRSHVQFAGRQPRLDYFRLYHLIDVCLDTFPYNGHTTSLDSLWMGVPVVTLAGKTAVSRGGASILSNAGLPDLIANTPDEYVSIATKLAADPARLADLRRTLRQNMQASPLTHGAQFARDVETTYRQMWSTWCDTRSERPMHDHASDQK